MNRSLLPVVILRTVMILLLSAAGCVKKEVPPPPPKDPYIVDVPGVEETLKIQTSPSRAKVTLSTGESCTSPCSFKKMSNETFDVNVEKDGYHPQSVTVVSNARAVPGSGAAGKPVIDTAHLTPNPVKVTLVPAR